MPVHKSRNLRTPRIKSQSKSFQKRKEKEPLSEGHLMSQKTVNVRRQWRNAFQIQKEIGF